MAIIDLFDRGVGLNPERICLKDGRCAVTFLQVQKLSYRIARALLRDGFDRDSHVAVYSPNCVAGFEAVLGVLRSGLPWVPVNAKNALPDNTYTLDAFDVRVLLYHSDFEAALPQIRESCPGITLYICIDREDCSSSGLQTWLGDVPETDPQLSYGRDDTVALLSSGGTTGRPKGILASQLSWDVMAANFYAGLDVGPDPVHLVIAPMTHAAGITGLVLMAAGATNVILSGFDAEAIMEAIEREKVTHLFLPPTAIYMLLAAPGVKDRDFSSLRHFLYAAAPMAIDKLREAIAVFGQVMTQSFGQSEAPMFCTIMTPEDHRVIDNPDLRHRLASCGRRTLLASVNIMDDEGRLLPAGERGEIVIRGDLVMKGYYKNPEATAEASAFGWHHTGDIGYLDEAGYLYIVDRKKDMIISGGFNVYPSEVEQVIWGHPAVQDCAVIGVPDEKWGEAVKAVIELKPGASVSPAEIIALCRERLGPVKAPKSAEIWPELPRSPVGKVRKKDIRDVFWRDAGRLI